MSDEDEKKRKKIPTFTVTHPRTGEITKHPLESGMVNDLKESVAYAEIKDDIQRRRREEMAKRGLK